MEILFLSHCVPNPPNKGDKIRAHYELRRLAETCRVHLVCFARMPGDMEAADKLKQLCASVYCEPLASRLRLARSAAGFALGKCLTASYFSSRRMQQHVRQLAVAKRLGATVVYCSSMLSYAPPAVPMVIDLVDVDSEKWFQYASLRWPSFPYSWEGRRLRSIEAEFAERAQCTFLSTAQETEVLKRFAPNARVKPLENGIDFEYFDPLVVRPAQSGRDRVVFVGQMDYYPNSEAVCMFADEIYPQLRRRWPSLEFIVVGRSPSVEVRRLAGRPGITVTGEVGDIRPYLAECRAVVAPIKIARGIQNKVLEALAMGRSVLASPAVCRTFGAELPDGVVRCDSAGDYEAALQTLAQLALGSEHIRNGARQRFSWNKNLDVLVEEVALANSHRPAAAAQ
jgi:polysaccharide biosynthesis protein PslH